MGNPVLEGGYRKRKEEVERGGEGDGGETDSRGILVAFGENRRGDKTGRERVIGGRNYKSRKLAVSLVHGVR